MDAATRRTLVTRLTRLQDNLNHRTRPGAAGVEAIAQIIRTLRGKDRAAVEAVMLAVAEAAENPAALAWKPSPEKLSEARDALSDVADFFAGRSGDMAKAKQGLTTFFSFCSAYRADPAAAEAIMTVGGEIHTMRG